MPVEVTLYAEAGDAWLQLRRCPSIERALRGGVRDDSVDVTALVLAETIYGHRYPFPPDDAAFLAGEVSDPVLLPGDICDEAGRPMAAFVGELRVSFLGWVASVARRVHVSIDILYSHERGDYLYQQARWTFGAREQLHFMSFDGNANPRWQRTIERPSAAPSEPREHGFYPFAALLRDRRR